MRVSAFSCARRSAHRTGIDSCDICLTWLIANNESDYPVSAFTLNLGGVDVPFFSWSICLGVSVEVIYVPFLIDDTLRKSTRSKDDTFSIDQSKYTLYRAASVSRSTDSSKGNPRIKPGCLGLRRVQPAMNSSLSSAITILTDVEIAFSRTLFNDMPGL